MGGGEGICMYNGTTNRVCLPTEFDCSKAYCIKGARNKVTAKQQQRKDWVAEADSTGVEDERIQI